VALRRRDVVRRIAGLAGPAGFVGVAAIAVFIGGACSDSTGDAAPDPLPSGTIVDSAASSTTAVVEGTTTDLLIEMVAIMSQLGSTIADGGGDEEMLDRILTIWDTASGDVQARRPELVAGIDTTLDMARLAVERTRPADADKAFILLSDLVDSYVGDG
jgi:hypothetical protein